MPPTLLPAVSRRVRALRRLPERVDEVRGFATRAADTGAKGPDEVPIVLVHGLAVSHRSWAPTIAALGGRRRVVAPDLPGVGGSSDPDRPLTLTDLADGLVGWLDVVGIDRGVLVGHSLGAHVVAEVAARHPERVVGLVLVSPAVDPGRWPIWQQGIRLALDGFRERPSMLPVAAADYLRVGAARMLQTVHRAKRLDLLEILSRVHLPTLVVDGGRDLMATRPWSARVAEVAGARLVVVPDGPHGLPWSSDHAVAAHITAFVEDLPALRTSEESKGGGR